MGFLAFLIVFRRREKEAGLIAVGSRHRFMAAIVVSWLGIGSALDRFASYKGLESQ